MLSHDEREMTLPEKTSGKTKRVFVEVVQFLLIIIFVIVPFRIFVAQPFIVNGASMDPTFETGQYIIVDQLTYHFSNPERGSVIIFHYPNNPKKFYIKRVIGLPGETVRIDNGTVFIVHNPNTSDGIEVLSEPYLTHTKEEDFEVTLDKDEYFVLGDNRPGSSDSRDWGPLEEKFIVGRAFVRLLPITQINLLPGQYEYK